jgi:hypothetical protein
MNREHHQRQKEYARRKAAWLKKNPSPSCEEYDLMVKKLCRELGV